MQRVILFVLDLYPQSTRGTVLIYLLRWLELIISSCRLSWVGWSPTSSRAAQVWVGKGIWWIASLSGWRVGECNEMISWCRRLETDAEQTRNLSPSWVRSVARGTKTPSPLLNIDSSPLVVLRGHAWTFVSHDKTARSWHNLASFARRSFAHFF